MILRKWLERHGLSNVLFLRALKFGNLRLGILEG
jgi:hypothetical protein